MRHPRRSGRPKPSEGHVQARRELLRHQPPRVRQSGLAAKRQGLCLSRSVDGGSLIDAAFFCPRRADHEAADHNSLCWRRSRARRRTGGKPGARGAGLSSRLVRKFARRPFWSTKRNRSLWTTRRNRSFWTAGRCRSFWTSATGRRRPAGRLLRRRPLPDLSQSGGSPAGARPVRSRSQRRAAVAARRRPMR